MPESRNRHKNKHHQHHGPVHQATVHHTPVRIRRSAALVLAILAAILGLAIAYFTQGADVMWLIAGVVSGAVIGYLVGHSMDKSFEKK